MTGLGDTPLDCYDYYSTCGAKKIKCKDINKKILNSNLAQLVSSLTEIWFPLSHALSFSTGGGMEFMFK